MALELVQSDLDQDQIDYLASLDNTTITCRAGGRHRFPPIVPGKPLPKRTKVSPSKAGCYLLEEHCDICGRVRNTVTYPRGVLGSGVVRRYKGGQRGYSGVGMGLTASNYMDEYGRRVASTIAEAAELQENQRRQSAS